MGLPAPKNIIADRSGVVTPEWLFWFQQIADATDRITAAPAPPLTPPPAVPGGGGGVGNSGLTIFNNYGSGTPGFITKWLAPQQLGDSLIQESGGAVMINGPVIATSFQGTLPLHALTHQTGGTDVITVTKLGGFPGGTALFLRADGTFAAPPGGSGGGGAHAPTHEPGGSDPIQNLSADILTSGTLPPARIGADAVTFDKLANLTASRLFGRGSAGGVGDPEPIVIGSGLTLSGTTLSASAVPGGMNLDYLGTYADGPVYNDGDIVIGPDNIAYLCVVDGTTTPPEPWPGIGVATAVGPPGPTGAAGTNAAVDATYWTATPHAGLVNERALNSLANGYVKSTAGEPSTVAIIPVADGGTGASTATQARTNLGCGTVATANYNGSSAYFLRGDGVWGIPPQPVGVPSGLIAIFVTACPVGWTRMAGWDGRFPRANTVAAVGTLGGSNNHYHLAGGNLSVPAHAHNVGLSMPSHTHGGIVGVNGTTGAGGSHAHDFGVHVVSAGSNQGTMNADAGSSGFVARGDHTHNINHDGTTGNAGDHTHAFSGSGSIPSDGGQAIVGTTATQAALFVAGNTDWATDGLPPFVDIVYCSKD